MLFVTSGIGANLRATEGVTCRCWWPDMAKKRTAKSARLGRLSSWTRITRKPVYQIPSTGRWHHTHCVHRRAFAFAAYFAAHLRLDRRHYHSTMVASRTGILKPVWFRISTLQARESHAYSRLPALLGAKRFLRFLYLNLAHVYFVKTAKFTGIVNAIFGKLFKKEIPLGTRMQAARLIGERPPMGANERRKFCFLSLFLLARQASFSLLSLLISRTVIGKFLVPDIGGGNRVVTSLIDHSSRIAIRNATNLHRECTTCTAFYVTARNFRNFLVDPSGVAGVRFGLDPPIGQRSDRKLDATDSATSFRATSWRRGARKMFFLGKWSIVTPSGRYTLAQPFLR